MVRFRDDGATALAVSVWVAQPEFASRSTICDHQAGRYPGDGHR